MTKPADEYLWIEAPQADRPDLARKLLDAAEKIGADPADPYVLSTTSDGFRVRRDVLEASGLHRDEPHEDASADGTGKKAAAAKSAPKSGKSPGGR